MSGIEVREMAGGEAAIAELTRRVWTETYAGRMWFPVWDAAFFRWQMQPGDERLHLGAFDGERLVGCVLSLRQTLRMGGAERPVSLSSWFSVDAAYRARGVLPRLMRTLRERHRELGLATSLAIVSGDTTSEAYRAWSQYARAYPQDLRFLFRFGLWAKVLDHEALTAAAVHGWERRAGRLLGPVLAALPPSRAQWRRWRGEDVYSCAALLDESTRSIDWSLVWPGEALTRQLGDPAASTWVAEGPAGIEAVASLHRLELHGVAPLRTACLDLWATGTAGAARRIALMAALCRELKADGLQLVLAQRSAPMPASTFLPVGFLPLPAQDHMVALFPSETLDLSPPKRWSLLFR